MANIKSQKKRNLTNAKRAERNKAARSELKTRIKTAVHAAGTEDGEVPCCWPRSASTRPRPRASSTGTRPPAARAD